MVQIPSGIALRVRSSRRRDFEHRKLADAKSGVTDMETAMDRIGRFTRAAVWAVVAMAASVVGAEAARPPLPPGVRQPIARLPIATRIQIPKGPAWLETGYGSVWVTDILGHQVIRIDHQTNRVIARIPVGSEPELGLGMGFGSVWVPDVRDRSITEIDPETNQVRRVIPVDLAPFPEGSIGVGEGGLWVITRADGTDAATLSQIDPVRGEVVAQMPVHPQSHAVTVAYGSVWVSSTADHVVSRIDPATHAVIAEIPMHAKPLFLAAGEGSVWVLCQGDGSLLRIDPATNTVIATVWLGVPGEGGDLSIDGGYVWVSAEGTPLTQIDPTDHRVLRQYVGGKQLDTLRVRFGAAWLVDAAHGQVWRVPVDQWH